MKQMQDFFLGLVFPSSDVTGCLILREEKTESLKSMSVLNLLIIFVGLM